MSSKPVRLTDDVMQMISDLALEGESPNKTIKRILMTDAESNNSAVEAINYALNNPDEDPLEFLQYWLEGDFDTLRNEWDNVPDEVFIGADPLFKPSKGKK